MKKIMQYKRNMKNIFNPIAQLFFGAFTYKSKKSPPSLIEIKNEIYESTYNEVANDLNMKINKAVEKINSLKHLPKNRKNDKQN